MYVFGKRKDDVFKQLKALLKPFNIARYYTDDWGAYERHLDTDRHEVGKHNTQKNRTQKLESTNVDQAFNKENYLFFQVGFDARYRHWVAYQ